MRIRSIEKRRAYNKKAFGLKVGKENIRSLSKTEVEALFLRFQKNVLRGNSNMLPNSTKPRRKKNIKKSYAGQKRRYNNLKRTIRLIRKTDNDGNRLPTYNYKPCLWLDSIYPNRKSNWKLRNQRKKTETISLRNFSFIDNPIGTYNLLKEIIAAEAKAKFSYIDFLDERCFDVAPYLVLGLMQKNLTKGVCQGGQVSGPISDVMHAVNLLDLYETTRMNKANCAFIFPFKIRSRRKSGSSTNDNLPHSETTEEKASAQFVETFNDWLEKLPTPLELTPEAYINIGTLFGELLENAKRHGDPVDADGEWHIAGFMEAIPTNDQSDPLKAVKYICHFSIVNPGNTIFDSMQHAPTDIKKAIQRHVENWKMNDDPSKTEAYWNLCAMQDGISRIHPTEHNPKNGFGIMQALVALMTAFGDVGDTKQEPVMTIVSGESCIMVKYPYNRYNEVDGRRILTFNDDNDLDKPPEADHVLKMPGRFPGTLITVRFAMDSSHLMKMASEGSSNGK